MGVSIQRVKLIDLYIFLITGSFLGGNIPTVFGLVTIIFFFCYLLTVTTFREIPLKLIERDNLLRPLSDKAIKRELKKENSNVYYIKEVSTKVECSGIFEIETVPQKEILHATNIAAWLQLLLIIYSFPIHHMKG